MKNISLKIQFSVIFISACLFASFGCGDQALFDELATNRVKVIIKGTYESNTPRDWEWSINPEDYEDDSVYLWRYVDQTPTKTDVAPTTFMLDIAGIKVASGGQSQYFANYRKTYSAAINDTDSFFNGDGVLYQNNDMRPNFTWPTLQVYIRKMLFNNAKQYVPNGVTGWTYEKDVEDMFDENTVNAFNFNLAQVLSYYDSLKSNYAEINRIFPLSIPVEDGFIFNNNDPETVLEIRLVVKNFVKKYEYEYTDTIDSTRKLRHFYALSDWLRDIKRDEAAPTTDTLGKMGGNLHAVVRSYVPGKTATITRTGGVTSDRYIIAVKYPHTLSEYLITTPISRPNCDEPKKPRAPILPANPDQATVNAYLEKLLDYYLQYEVYKANYDSFTVCTDTANYTAQYDIPWNNYENAVSLFKIPPLATYSVGSGYRLENVPAGTYTIYAATNAVPAGELPSTSSNFLQRGVPITITEDDFNTDVTGP